IGRAKQGVEKAGIQVRRLDDLLCHHAGRGHGKRPSCRQLPPFRTCGVIKAETRLKHPLHVGWSLSRLSLSFVRLDHYTIVPSLRCPTSSLFLSCLVAAVQTCAAWKSNRTSELADDPRVPCPDNSAGIETGRDGGRPASRP